MKMLTLKKIITAFMNPGKTLDSIFLLGNGYQYKMRYRLTKRDVLIGHGFRVRGKLSIKGPGKVVIGNNVLADGTSHPVTPWTYSKEAAIVIGDNVFLNGTRFGCAKNIEIGHDTIIADCRIIDTDFHSVCPDKRTDPAYVESAPVKIGNNVWLAIDCVVLRGVSIGDGSTVRAMSVVVGNIPAYSVYGGNPAVFLKEAPRASSDLKQETDNNEKEYRT